MTYTPEPSGTFRWGNRGSFHRLAGESTESCDRRAGEISVGLFCFVGHAPFDEFVGNVAYDRQVIVDIFGFQHGLLGFGADPPPVWAVAQQDSGVVEVLGASLAVEFQRLERRPQRETAVAAEETLGVLGPRRPHQRKLHAGIKVAPDASVPRTLLRLRRFSITSTRFFFLNCALLVAPWLNMDWIHRKRNLTYPNLLRISKSVQ